MEERNVLDSAFGNGYAKSWTKRVHLPRQNLGVWDGMHHGGARSDQNILARLREARVDELRFVYPNIRVARAEGIFADVGGIRLAWAYEAPISTRKLVDSCVDWLHASCAT